MNERFLSLMEKYFDNELTGEEKTEFEEILNSDVKLKNEFEEQKRVKEVLSKMRLKNPSNEIWDSYWMGIYNKLERGLAWIAVSVGSIILIAYGSWKAVGAFINDTQTPVIIKVGVALLIFGGLVLLFSVIREKLFTSKHDKYKEIQR